MTTKYETRKAPVLEANAPEDVNFTAADAEYLHWTGRKDHLEDLEQHLLMAARLSRALWELIGSSDFPMDSKRSVFAAKALADAVADHASAAEFIFNTSE